MAEPVERYWRLEAYRNKLRHSLAARFLLRFHVALILAVTILAGWLADRLLLEVMHVETILLRYPLSIFAAYFVFYAGVALVVAFFIGVFAQAQVPPATTLHQLWTTMRHPGR